jgi:hypothetical protein
MLNKSSNVFDEILEGQVKGKPNGIGFDYEHLNQNNGTGILPMP